MSKWTGNQIGLYRLYANQKGKPCKLLGDAATATDRLTLDEDFLRTVRFDHHGVNQENQFGKTPFKEVRVALPELFGKMKEVAMSPQPWRLGKPEPLKKIVDLIERDWDSDKFHLCFHSSGYDSRFISSILMKLREKNGEGWLGRLLFLCWEPEGDIFQRIMKSEGWKSSQYHVYRKGVGIDYRAELIGFENVWKWVNDYGHPCLPHGVSVDDAIRKNLAPRAEEIYVLSMQHENVYTLNTYMYQNEGKPPSWKHCFGGMRPYPNPLINMIMAYWYYPRNYMASWSGVPCREIKIPYLDMDVLPFFYYPAKKKITDFAGYEWDSDGFYPSVLEFRIMLINEINPALATIPVFPHKKLNEEPQWIKCDRRLSEAVRVQAAKKFNDSWYAKNTDQPEPAIAPELGDHSTEWWRKYVLASLCEHVTNQGIKIRAS